MLTKKNAINYAMRHYDNPECRTIEEFKSDLNSLIYIKKLIRRIANNEQIDFRLVLNHIVIFFNKFDDMAACSLLFLKVESEYHPILAAFLDSLNRLPTRIPDLNIQNITIDDSIRIKLKCLL